VPAAVLVASDPQCLKVMGNRRANELYEVKEKENLSVGALLKVRRYFTPEGRELLPSELPLRLAAATNQDVRDKEFSMLLPSGKRMTLLGSAVPLRDDQNQVRGCIGAFLDITERKQMEEALQVSERRLRWALQAAGGAAWDLNLASGEAWWSPEMYELWGVPPDTPMVMDNSIALVHEADREALRKAVEEAITKRTDLICEFRVMHSVRGERWMLSLGRPLTDDSGQAVRLLGLSLDITERRKAEEEREALEKQLRQAQKMESVGRLAGGVAHDFNNMLNVIIGYSEMVLDQLKDSDPLYRDIHEIMNAGRRSADLTRQLLAFARKQAIQPRVLDLNDTIAGMLKMLGRLIGEDIDLHWKPTSKLWPVRMDPAQLDQILANLTVNARDAIAGIGKIIIETAMADLKEDYCHSHPGSVPGRYVMLTISDTGCGMDSESQAHLFEPFFTTKPQGQGTGLGLATVYGIVKQNDGFIQVYSELGYGTTFKIYLPACEPAMLAEVKKAASTDMPQGTETVLLVEDEKSVLELSRRLIERLGYKVLATGSPFQAIQIVTEYTGEIHLLLSDVVMPEMNGRDLQQRLNALRPGMKCLFMSGYTTDTVAHQGVLDRDVHFLQKPFSNEALALKLREALE
jgi:PAS domain S-box-containing protein